MLLSRVFGSELFTRYLNNLAGVGEGGREGRIPISMFAEDSEFGVLVNIGKDV